MLPGIWRKKTLKSFFDQTLRLPTQTEMVRFPASSSRQWSRSPRPPRSGSGCPPPSSWRRRGRRPSPRWTRTGTAPSPSTSGSASSLRWFIKESLLVKLFPPDRKLLLQWQRFKHKWSLAAAKINKNSQSRDNGLVFGRHRITFPPFGWKKKHYQQYINSSFPSELVPLCD